MALSLVPALIRAGVRLRFRPAWRHPAVRKLRDPVRLDARLRGRQPGGADRGEEPGPAGQRRAGRLRQGLHVLPAPARPAGGVDHHHVRPRPGPLRGPQGQGRRSSPARPSGVRLVALFTFPASLGLLVLARPIIGAFLQHGEFSEQAAVTTSRALAGLLHRPGGLLRLPVRAPRVLRPPGHPHAVRDQRGARTCSTSSSPSCWSAATACSGWAWPSRSPTCSSAAWALQVLSYKVPGYGAAPRSSPAWAGCCWPRVLMAELVWLVTRLVGGNSGLGRPAGSLVGHASSASSSTSACWRSSASPELRGPARRSAWSGRRLPA